MRALPPLPAGEATFPSPQSTMATSDPPSSLEDMVKRVPSLEMFMNSIPANTHKSLPPLPPIQHSASLRRSSSVYTGATGVWDEELVSPTRPYSESQSLNTSDLESSVAPDSPSTPWSSELINPIPPFLVPRDYAPILPSPSPSLAPKSRNNSCIPPFDDSIIPDKTGQREGWWTMLAPSPPLSPMPGRKMSRSTLDLSLSRELPPRAPIRARSTSPPSSRLSRPFISPIVEYREESRNKALSSLGITEEEASLPQGRQEKKKLPSRFFSYTRKFAVHISKPRSLTFLPGRSKTNRSAKESPTAKPGKAIASEVEDEQQDEESKTKPDRVSVEPPRPFVYEFQDFAAPSQAQWDDSSEDEDKGRYLRLVPAPLFWKNRQQELNAKKVEQSLANKEIEDRPQDSETKGTKWGKKNKEDESAPSSPPTISLTGQPKDQDMERGRARSTSPKPLTRSFFKTRRRAASKPAPLNSPAQQNKKDADEPPLPLQLPSIAYSRSDQFGSPNTGYVKSAHRSARVIPDSPISSNTSPARSPPSHAHAFPRPPIESTSPPYVSGTSDVAASPGFSDEHSGPEPNTPNEIEQSIRAALGSSRPSFTSAHKQTQSASTTYSHRSSASSQTKDFDQIHDYSNLSAALPRVEYPAQYTGSQPLRIPTSDPSTPPPGKASYSVFSKSWSTPPNASHKRTTSSTSAKDKETVISLDTIGVPYGEMKIRDKQVDDQYTPGRTSSSYSRPSFIEKALEAKRERDRRKHRKDLIASIKHVGRTSPYDVEDDRGRRGTFGEGWA
jgi:hypothetical protein